MFRFAQHDEHTSGRLDGATIELCNLFTLVTFLVFLTFNHAYYCHGLPRSRFILVFLVRADMGGIKEAV